MSKSRVRCWKIHNGTDEIFITYPEENSGHRLISCLNCGKIYAVSVARMVYDGLNLEIKLSKMNCAHCRQKLVETYGFYPEQYLSDGRIVSFERPRELPADSRSITCEFDEIYGQPEES